MLAKSRALQKASELKQPFLQVCLRDSRRLRARIDWTELAQQIRKQGELLLIPAVHGFNMFACTYERLKGRANTIGPLHRIATSFRMKTGGSYIPASRHCFLAAAEALQSVETRSCINSKRAGRYALIGLSAPVAECRPSVEKQ